MVGSGARSEPGPADRNRSGAPSRPPSRALARGRGANQEEIRRHNLGTLLGLVHRSNGVSRARLTEQMGLNRSTIADLVRELEDTGAVVQTAPSRGGRDGAGRPSINVVPLPESVYVLAVRLGVETTEVAKVGLGGAVLSRKTAPTPDQSTPDVMVEHLGDLLETLGAGSGGRLIGICVAVPGIVAHGPGVVRFAPNLGWVDVPLAQMLADRLGGTIPVLVGNDAELGALAEHTRGAGQSRSTVIYLCCDVGVGVGVIVDGHPLRGASGYAGEVGHLPFGHSGQVCRCGNTNCWETDIGLHAIARAVGCPENQIELLTGFLSIDRPAPDALRELGRTLGAGLGGLVNIYNPDTIILGGVFPAVLPSVRDEVLAAMNEKALVAPVAQVEVVLPGLAGDSILVGAAEQGFAELLADPIGVLGESRPVTDRTVADEAGSTLT